MTEELEWQTRRDRINKMLKFLSPVWSIIKTYVEKLNQSIVAKAFLGELVPQNPYDEPAGNLLELIRTDIASKIASGKKKRRAKKTTEVKSCR